MITAAPTHQRLVAEFEGAEAHAGIRPEDGRSAIEAAAAAVTAMRLGRLDEQTTANVGVIEGGTAANVVAGHCRLEAEARSLDEGRIAETTSAMLDACTWAASEHSCDVDLDVTEIFRGYRQPSSSPAVRLAREALERRGHQPREVATGGGSDANALVARGFECVLLANGTEANHTPQESVAAARIVEMLGGLRVDRRARRGGLMLKLRRGVVVSVEPLTVEVDGERRPAWADPALIGPVEVGDEVVVNTEALDLGLGSGGFDLVHVNLSRGLAGGGAAGEHVMKLNYTSLQHPVEPVEARRRARGRVATARPWSSRCTVTWRPPPGRRRRRARGCDSASSRGRARRCRARSRATSPSFASAGLICGHVTAGAAYGGEHEAISVAGALDAAGPRLGWDAIVVGPGPGSSARRRASATAGWRRSTRHTRRWRSACRRWSARGFRAPTSAIATAASAITRRSLLELLLAPVRVPVPEAEIEGWPLLAVEAPEGGSAQAALDDLIEICSGRHDIAVEADRPRRLRASGLPAQTMGRTLAEDPLFFAAPLAAGRALAGAVSG